MISRIRSHKRVLLAAAALTLAGCEVTNPGPIADENLNEVASHTGLVRGAERATEFAGDGPLLFGGDFNVRPKQSGVFDRLAERFGLAPPTGPDRLSHLLARGLEVVDHPRALPPEARDLVDPDTGLKIRLSDHHPVVGTFATVE